MTVYVGIDAVPFERTTNLQDSEESAEHFNSMLGCAIVTEDIEGITNAYSVALSAALSRYGINVQRKVLSSTEILGITKGNFDIHEEIFKAISGKISRLNIFYTIFNSKRIPKIKVYGRKQLKEITVNDFYDKHLNNSFPHICLWKIFSYIYGSKAKVYIDNFYSEITEAWELISKYPLINCYINGDMTNILISIADIICKLTDNRLKEKDWFLTNEHIEQLFPELDKNKLYPHWIGNKHLPRITMVHSNKVSLHNYIKRPILFIYLEKGNRIDKRIILNSAPNFLNFVHAKDGCVKFFTPFDIYSMKDGDYLISVNKKAQSEVETLKGLLENQMKIRIHSTDISNFGTG